MQCFNYKGYISSRCPGQALVIEEWKDVVDELLENLIYNNDNTFLGCIQILSMGLDFVTLILDTSRQCCTLDPYLTQRCW